jgi:DNA replication protein DnaC
MSSSTNRVAARFKPVDPEEVKRREQSSREAEHHRLLNALAADFGQRYSPKLAKLETFDVYTPAQQAAVDRLKKLVGSLESMTESGAGLVFLGTVGTGKDHLMAAMLYQAVWRHGYSARWVNGQEVFGRFRDNIDSGARDEEYFRMLSAPQLLGISDPIPPVGNLGQWDTGNLYRLLDRRYRALKPTWVSVNAMDEADADARLSAPVFDRLRHGAEIIRCFWPSYRERKVS